jgi:hypothetical protein
MNKVYFDKEKKVWFVNETEDFYSFKSVNYKTKEEENQILSWTRGFDLTNYPNHVRMYDVEIEGFKYFFLMRHSDNDCYILDTENPLSLEQLINEHFIFFAGETI